MIWRSFRCELATSARCSIICAKDQDTGSSKLDELLLALCACDLIVSRDRPFVVGLQKRTQFAAEDVWEGECFRMRCIFVLWRISHNSKTQYAVIKTTHSILPVFSWVKKSMIAPFSHMIHLIEIREKLFNCMKRIISLVEYLYMTFNMLN